MEITTIKKVLYLKIFTNLNKLKNKDKIPIIENVVCFKVEQNEKYLSI